MTRVPDIRMARDKTQRVTLACIDDTHRKNQVTAARAALYDRNLGVASAAVEDLLKPMSLVPNQVILSLTFSTPADVKNFRILSWTDCLQLGLIFT
jgi:hypothetical protein